MGKFKFRFSATVSNEDWARWQELIREHLTREFDTARDENPFIRGFSMGGFTFTASEASNTEANRRAEANYWKERAKTFMPDGANQFERSCAILGIPTEHTQAELKAAYRKLARQYHPDLNKESDAEEKMKAINAAHEYLRTDK